MITVAGLGGLVAGYRGSSAFISHTESRKHTEPAFKIYTFNYLSADCNCKHVVTLIFYLNFYYFYLAAVVSVALICLVLYLLSQK